MFYTICEKGAYFRIQRLIFYLSVFKIEISNRDAKTIHLNLNFQKSGVRNMGYIVLLTYYMSDIWVITLNEKICVPIQV